MKAIQRMWVLELSEDELIALARACAEYQEALERNGRVTVDQLQTMHYIKMIDDKFPPVDWFSKEARV